MGSRAQEEALGVAEIDLQRLRASASGPRRPLVSYRQFAYPELTSAPLELAPGRRGSFASAKDDALTRPLPQLPKLRASHTSRRRSGQDSFRSFARNLQFDLRGALYDLMHYEDLSPQASGYRSKVHYAVTREGRGPRILCCVLAVLAALALLVALL